MSMWTVGYRNWCKDDGGFWIGDGMRWKINHWK